MKDRIKTLRKTLALTQTAFGARIGLKGNTITGYENGIRKPSEAVICSICREFNVNEGWLRTGKGDMFVEMTDDDKLAFFLGSVLNSESPDVKKRLISALSKLNDKQWQNLGDIIDTMFKT